MGYQEDKGLTNSNLTDKYLRLAREAEDKATQRMAVIRNIVERESLPRLKRDWRGITEEEFQKRVDDVTNTKCAGSSNTTGDPTWAGHVANNQWYTRYATMYGAAATRDEMRELRGTMQSLLRYIQEQERR